MANRTAVEGTEGTLVAVGAVDTVAVIGNSGSVAGTRAATTTDWTTVAEGTLIAVGIGGTAATMGAG